jgi:hypothetical protein
MKTSGFIGGGRITRILLNGFQNANVSFKKINVYETNETVSGILDLLKYLKNWAKYLLFPKIKLKHMPFSSMVSSARDFLTCQPVRPVNRQLILKK